MLRPGAGLGFSEPRPKPTEAKNSYEECIHVGPQPFLLATCQIGSTTPLWGHCHHSFPSELLTVPSVLFSTQKHSSHCSFEEEHHQIHPTDVS